MNIIIQKFGGTSLASRENSLKVIQHIEREMADGYSVVVVVSAMGRLGEPYATDTLLKMVEEYGGKLPERETDLLLSTGEIISAAVLAGTLHVRGHDIVVLTGAQAGIVTNDQFGNAQIIHVQPQRIINELEKGKLVIVTGFQGATIDGELTTLGRGGSDTSATALGASLHAEYVDIYTDVDGIMTADPRIVEDARPLTQVSYTEMANLAHQGAKVIHPRAVEMAMQGNVTVRVRSTFLDASGTVITHQAVPHGIFKDVPITGITYMPYVTQIKVSAQEGQNGLQVKVFSTMAENGISVDFINVHPKAIAYTVKDSEAERAKEIIARLGYQVELTPHCAKVSAVGAGMAGIPGVMAAIVEALADEDIEILQAADSHTTIWILVSMENMARAVRALHRKFGLNKKPFA